MSAFTTDPFHTSNCRCCEAHARTLTDLAALVELGKERDYAMEMVNVQDNQIDALRALLTTARDALAEIALAGMSLPVVCGDDEQAKMRFHARQAWTFISVAANAKLDIDAALKDKP